jgi:pyruvate ferredoxin oxidoreductase gamma subunit
MHEIRFHGRGGQGAVTAAELLAVAAVEDGKQARSFPFFGVERRGAPVQAFCRISDEPIRINQHVYEPDYLVVLDSSLFKAVDICAGLKEQGVVVANFAKDPSELKIDAEKVYTVDATKIALRAIGRPIVNTAMLGAFARATKLVSLESLENAVRHRFGKETAEKNIAAMRQCCENTGGME